MRPLQSRLLTLEAALQWRAALRRAGATLAVTNGCFDVLHAGHVASLHAARIEADALLVLLNSDASVRALKGPSRPIHPEAARALVLTALRPVDAVVVFPGTDCAAELAALAPDLYAKSVEYCDRQNPAEAAALAACHARTLWLPRDDRYSTTAAVQAAEASGGRGSSLPQDPHECGAPADGAEYSPIAAAPVGRASTPDICTVLRRPNAGGGEAEALTALPAPSSASAADRILVGARGSELPRPPETMAGCGSVDITGTDGWGVP